MWSLEHLTDSNNWVFRADLSHEPQTIIYEYMGGLHPPIQHANAELAALQQRITKLEEALDTAVKVMVADIELISYLAETEKQQLAVDRVRGFITTSRALLAEKE